jgi:hypothetical protein
MIDGVYIRQALQEAAPDPAAAARPVLDYLDFWIAAAGDRQ